MDYEQKYKDALDAARHIYDAMKSGVNFGGMEDLEVIFPELAESEDERIRKWLADYFSSIKATVWIHRDITCEQILDWLEKQKEKNGEDEECTDFTIYHPLKNGKGKYECIPYSFYGSLTSFSEDKDLIDFLRTCFYTEKECNEWIEHQKEQKPDIEAKLKEEYKRGWDNALLQLPEEVDSQIWQIANNSAKTWEQGFAILMAAKKAFDKGKAEGLKEQKPAEWSEEDEKMRNIIIETLDDDSNYFPFKKTKMKMMDWLKSLRPSWKPSEEQMEAPRNVPPIEGVRKLF